MKTVSRALRMLILCAAWLMILSASRVQAGVLGDQLEWLGFAPLEVNGFCELLAGARAQYDPHEKGMSVAEARLQAELFTYNDWVEIKYKGDVWADGISEGLEYDTRELWIFSRPAGFIDIKIGRQVLTWGTGNLVFLNDLFPKDWQSFFIGRDKEYLKAPSDALKISLFAETLNLDLVYVPRFNPDRYITGEYISYWSENKSAIVGNNDLVDPDTPDAWFEDHEIAVRLYGRVSGFEWALYGYRGFWKTPSGRNAAGRPIFPGLNAYGFSLRGPLGSGIANLECAYYYSFDDAGGTDPLIKNSQIRYLVGYEHEIGRDAVAAVQYYVEQMVDYEEYEQSLGEGARKDRFRHVITFDLSKLLMNQNLELVLSGYFSPSDLDAYLRPNIKYKYSDQVTFQVGANIFLGADQYTFFGQFEGNTNTYLSVRYSF